MLVAFGSLLVCKSVQWLLKVIAGGVAGSSGVPEEPQNTRGPGTS